MEIIEQIRQEKIKSIEAAVAKSKEFEQSYKNIYQHKYLKISKNASFNLVRIVLLLLAILFIVIALFCFFPDFIISQMEQNDEVFTVSEKSEFASMCKGMSFLLLVCSTFFIFLAYIIKSNNKKRTVIYEQSQLLENILEYMDSDIKEQKKRYEVYVDEHPKNTFNH